MFGVCVRTVNRGVVIADTATTARLLAWFVATRVCTRAKCPMILNCCCFCFVSYFLTWPRLRRILRRGAPPTNMALPVNLYTIITFHFRHWRVSGNTFRSNRYRARAPAVVAARETLLLCAGCQSRRHRHPSGQSLSLSGSAGENCICSAAIIKKKTLRMMLVTLYNIRYHRTMYFFLSR